MRTPLRRSLVERERLAVVAVQQFRQGLVHELPAASVEERPITRHRHQHRPTVVIPIPRWCRCYSTCCFLSSMSPVSDWTLVDLRPLQLFNNTGLRERALIIRRAA
jgi:hypothetical protein